MCVSKMITSGTGLLLSFALQCIGFCIKWLQSTKDLVEKTNTVVLVRCQIFHFIEVGLRLSNAKLVTTEMYVSQSAQTSRRVGYHYFGFQAQNSNTAPIY